MNAKEIEERLDKLEKMFLSFKKKVPLGNFTAHKQQTMNFDSNKMVFGKMQKFMTEDTFADPRKVR